MSFFSWRPENSELEFEAPQLLPLWLQGPCTLVLFLLQLRLSVLTHLSPWTQLIIFCETKWHITAITYTPE